MESVDIIFRGVSRDFARSAFWEGGPARQNMPWLTRRSVNGTGTIQAGSLEVRVYGLGFGGTKVRYTTPIYSLIPYYNPNIDPVVIY